MKDVNSEGSFPMKLRAIRVLFAGLLVALVFCAVGARLVQADRGGVEVDPYEDGGDDPYDDGGDDPYDDGDDPYDDGDDPYDDGNDADPDGDEAYDDVDDPNDDEGDWDWDQPNPKSALLLQEPIQKAVIAWNGREQIMVLITELKGSRKGQMMEIMPVPSRPTVTKGDPRLFAKTMDLFRSKQSRPARTVRSRGTPPVAGGEIIETVKIGYHNIAVARVVNPQQFVRWAEDYVKRHVGRRAKPVITKTGRQVISQYLREGYKYWVFDLIEPDTELQPHVAIQYRFQTDYLYYPLKITRTVGRGNTHVQLLVLTDGLLTHFRGLDHKKIKVPQPAATISSRELRELSTDVADLFGPRPVKLRLWEIEGPIQSLTDDVLASNRPVRRIRFR